MSVTPNTADALRRPTRLLSGALFLLWLAFAPPGCSVDEVPSVPADGDEEESEFTTDGDPENPEATEGSVGIELLPSADSGFLPQQITPFWLDRFDGTLKLVEGVSLTGEVQLFDQTPVEASALFTPVSPSLIPGQSLPNLTASTNALDAGALKAVFTLSLLTGAYTVAIYPKDEAVAPPLIWDNSFSISGQMQTTFQFEEGLPLKGVLTLADGTPASNVRVRAFRQSGTERSSSFLTDAEGGFTLLLPSRAGDYSVEVGGNPEASLLPVRIFENAATVTGSGEVRPSQTDDQDRLPLAYDAFPAIVCRLEGHVLFSQNSGTTAVANAKISLEGEVGGGVFHASALSGSDGLFVIDMPRTASTLPVYALSIWPPVEGEAAALRIEQFQCKGTAITQDFTLTARPVLSGRIAGPDGEPLANAEIRLQKLAQENDANVYVKSTTSLSDGAYSLTLDPGIYTLIVQGPAGAGLARHQTDEVALNDNRELDVTLAQGSVLTGTVVSPNDDPIPWVYVTVFNISGGAAVVAGAASTDESGHFEIILP